MAVKTEISRAWTKQIIGSTHQKLICGIIMMYGANALRDLLYNCNWWLWTFKITAAIVFVYFFYLTLMHFYVTSENRHNILLSLHHIDLSPWWSRQFANSWECLYVDYDSSLRNDWFNIHHINQTKENKVNFIGIKIKRLSVSRYTFYCFNLQLHINLSMILTFSICRMTFSK